MLNELTQLSRTKDKNERKMYRLILKEIQRLEDETSALCFFYYDSYDWGKKEMYCVDIVYKKYIVKINSKSLSRLKTKLTTVVNKAIKYYKNNERKENHNGLRTVQQQS